MPTDHGSLSDRPPASARIALVVIVALCAFLMALKPVRSPDVWHHVKSGWFVVQNRGPASGGRLQLHGAGQAVDPVRVAGAAHHLWGLTGRRRDRAGAVSGRGGGARGAAADGGDPRSAARGRVGGGPRDGAGALRGLASILLAARGVHVDPLRRLARWRSRKSVPGAARISRFRRSSWSPWVNMHGAWPAGLAWLGLICAGETALLLFGAGRGAAEAGRCCGSGRLSALRRRRRSSTRTACASGRCRSS